MPGNGLVIEMLLGQEAMPFIELYQLSIPQAPPKCRLTRSQPRPSDLDALGNEGA